MLLKFRLVNTWGDFYKILILDRIFFFLQKKWCYEQKGHHHKVMTVAKSAEKKKSCILFNGARQFFHLEDAFTYNFEVCHYLKEISYIIVEQEVVASHSLRWSRIFIIGLADKLYVSSISPFVALPQSGFGGVTANEVLIGQISKHSDAQWFYLLLKLAK